MFIYLLKYVDKKYLFILIIIPLLKQTLVSSILISNDYQRYNKDLELVNYIKTNINDNNKKIIFVGRFNNGIKIKGETLGNSFAEWDYYTEIGVNGRLNGLLKTQGINNINPSDIEYNLAINYDLIQSSDIINLDNYIYINLDNIKV